ncbi:MAG: type II secretion system F family protein [Alphaproteobacteria bacterium]|nr:type II secretion system F family protein [Alphaproteobacteria bacterium]
MYFDPSLLIYAAVFVGTLFLIEGVYYLIRDMREGPQQALNRRMRMIAAGTDTQTTLRKLRRDTKDPLSRMLAGIAPSLDRLILHAGMTISITRLILVMLSLWACLYGILETLTPTSTILSLLIAMIAGVGLPFLYLIRKKSVRLREFGEQLPDSLDLIVRGLRAGHPVSAALSLVSKEMPDPVGSEVGIVVDEMTYGLDLSEALRNLAARVPHEDLQFLVVTIQIQYMVGGNLAEVLGNLSQIIRDRYQMFAKIRAVTAEGRSSAVLIGILPMIFAGFMIVTNPEFFTKVIDDPLFWPMVAGGVALMLIGQFIIYKMVNFKV